MQKVMIRQERITAREHRFPLKKEKTMQEDFLEGITNIVNKQLDLPEKQNHSSENTVNAEIESCLLAEWEGQVTKHTYKLQVSCHLKT